MFHHTSRKCLSKTLKLPRVDSRESRELQGLSQRLELQHLGLISDKISNISVLSCSRRHGSWVSAQKVSCTSLVFSAKFCIFWLTFFNDKFFLWNLQQPWLAQNLNGKCPLPCLLFYNATDFITAFYTVLLCANAWWCVIVMHTWLSVILNTLLYWIVT